MHRCSLGFRIEAACRPVIEFEAAQFGLERERSVQVPACSQRDAALRIVTDHIEEPDGRLEARRRRPSACPRGCFEPHTKRRGEGAEAAADAQVGAFYAGDVSVGPALRVFADEDVPSVVPLKTEGIETRIAVVSAYLRRQRGTVGPRPLKALASAVELALSPEIAEFRLGMPEMYRQIAEAYREVEPTASRSLTALSSNRSSLELPK